MRRLEGRQIGSGNRDQEAGHSVVVTGIDSGVYSYSALLKSISLDIRL